MSVSYSQTQKTAVKNLGGFFDGWGRLMSPKKFPLEYKERLAKEYLRLNGRLDEFSKEDSKHFELLRMLKKDKTITGVFHSCSTLYKCAE